MATEEIIARYTLEIGDLKTKVSQLENEFKKLTDAEKKAGKEGEDAFKKTAEEADKTSKSTDNFTETLKGVGTAIVAAFAVDRIIAFGTECVKAFGEAEANALKLKSAVSVNGGLNEDFQKLLDQSGELQSITIFSDDDIQALQTSALQFGLTADEVERLTPIVTDFASATGQDLQSAFSVIVAGTNGAVKGLRQYGISLEEGQTKQENYIQITEALTKKFNGQAEALANTSGGSLTKLSNAWDDLKETIGSAIAPAVVSIAGFTKAVVEGANASEKESVALERQQQAFKLTRLEILQSAVGTEKRTNAIKALQAEYPNLLGNIDAEKIKNADLRVLLEKVNDQYIYKIALAKSNETLTPILEEEGKAADNVATATSALNKELQKVLDQSAKSRTGIKESNVENIKFLEEIDPLAAAEFILKKQVALEGVNASLGNLQSAYEEVQSAQISYSSASLKAKDATAEFDEKVLSLKKTFGITDEAIKQGGQTVVNYKTLTLKELKELADKGDTFADSEIDRRNEAGKKAYEERKKALEELRKLADEANQRSLQQLAENEIDKLNIEREGALKRAQELLKSAGGQNNKDAIKAFKEAELAINAEYDDKIKDARIKKLKEGADERAKIVLDELNQANQAELNRIDDETQQAILALKKQYLEKGEFTEKEEKKLQDAITKIQLDAEKKRIEETKKQREKLATDTYNLAVGNALQIAIQEEDGNVERATQNQNYLDAVEKANAEYNKAKTASDQQYTKDATALAVKTTDNAIAQGQVEADNWFIRNEEKIKQAQATANEIINTFNAIVQAQIQAKEEELNALQEAFDAETEALQFQYDKRLIGAGDFEVKQKQLREQKLADEKRIQAEITKLKRQEDIANRARAIFEIGINTALAISKVLTNPFLITLVSILGAAQLAAVLATPLPKYAKGTKYLKRGNNPSGTDTIPIMADEGERIISAKQNKKYWSVYEAIDDGKFEDYMHDKYIAPHLQKQSNTFRAIQNQSIADSIVTKLMIDEDSLASKIGAELEWRNRKGYKIVGMEQLIEAIETQPDPRKQ